jgi:enoyl-CoA hydratase/carnithine racemase
MVAEPALEYVQIEDTLPVVTITLNRPAQRNALSSAMMRELRAAFGRQAARRDCLAIVLRAAGPVFCSGHDLRELTGRTLDDERAIFELCSSLMTTIQQIPQPVIAAVRGVATAAGCQLVATCDLAIAAETASFATPGVKIGLFCSTPMVAVSRSIGRKRALQMLLSGQPIDARTAADWGLINEAVPAERVEARAHELAAQIAAASGLTLKIGKQAFYEQIDLPQTAAYARMSEVMAENAMTCDAQEGIGAFLEKRAPQWRGE